MNQQSDKDLLQCLLNIGSLLMSAGASTNRIRLTIERIANGMGYHSEILVTNRTVLITIINQENNNYLHNIKKTPPHGVNFALVSGISKLSWKAVEENLTVAQINAEIEIIQKINNYSFPLKLVLVSLACVGFCRLIGGEFNDLVLTFFATLAGFYVRHTTVHNKFNNYLSVFFGSFVASIVASIGLYFQFVPFKEDLSLQAAVLFLIPGVPFINAFADLIDGNLTNGTSRGVNTLFIAFAIAIGIISARLIFNL